MRQKVRQAVVIQEGVRDFETMIGCRLWYVVSCFLLCLWSFTHSSSFSGDTRQREPKKNCTVDLISQSDVDLHVSGVFSFKIAIFDMSCHEFGLSLRVEFRCASDLEDEECSVSKVPEVVVTGKTHLECVESSEGFCCASREA